MANHAASAVSILLLSIATAAWVTAVPTVQAGTDALRRNLYGSASPELFDALFDDHDALEPRNLDDDRVTHLRSSTWPKQGRRGIDFSSGLTSYLIDDADVPSAARSAGLLPGDRMLLEGFAKRNIDEIDRTSFDNFFKRSDDEMDRSEWNGFVKRLADYLIAARTNALERRG
ncbi:orcokinin peptides isoform X2 [Xylocopa sonorina]|uniref:orcokinin peptides isoform X2 n=1 Tax=Xylocopa sonorina TaxID=1818115 RepID=UPI00403B2BB9